MSPQKKQRLSFLIFALVCLGVSGGLIFGVLKEHLVFFYHPREVYEKVSANTLSLGTYLRIGGWVEPGSLERNPASLRVRFRLTDFQKSLTVAYTGILPDLFEEGQGVVAEGYLLSPTTFKATLILAKHDETYCPPHLKKE